jgi:hypothetical protein
MKSTAEHPLAFFDWYIENEIHKDLKEFYVNITEELYFNNSDVIDEEKHLIKVLDIQNLGEGKSKYITFSFEGFIKAKLKQEIKQTKAFLELGFQERFSDKKEVKAYADFLRIKLSSFNSNRAYKVFPFLASYFDEIESLVHEYSKQVTSDSSRLLSFYFNMLFVNSIEQVKSSFIGNSTLQDNNFSFIQNQNYYMKEEMVEDNGVAPIFVTDIISKEDFLERLLNFENISIYKSIESEVLNKQTKQDKATYIEKVYSDIQVLLKRVLKLEDADVRLIEDKLIEIINNLKDRYSKIVTYHDVYKYLIKESDATFFKNKDLKYSFYQDLYELAYTLYLIDDPEIEELDFINAFTSPTPQILQNKIRFSKNNYVVAYFLETLKPFFNGFTHIAIEKSEVFLNKQNKPIKSTDIYTSLSRGKTRIEEEKTKIDAHILNLKNEYIK